MTISCFPCGCHAIHISYNTHTNYIGSLIQTLFCSYCTLNWWYLKTHTVTHCAYTKWPWPTPLGGGFPCYLSAAFVGPVYSLAWHTFYLQRPFHWKAVVTEAWGALCVCVCSCTCVHVCVCVCHDGKAKALWSEPCQFSSSCSFYCLFFFSPTSRLYCVQTKAEDVLFPKELCIFICSLTNSPLWLLFYWWVCCAC